MHFIFFLNGFACCAVRFIGSFTSCIILGFNDDADCFLFICLFINLEPPYVLSVRLSQSDIISTASGINF